MLLKGIVNQLKTGEIKNVIPYGMTTKSPRYIVVKEGADILGRGTSFTITVHMPKGHNEDLKKYVRKEVSDLLDDFTYTDPESGTSYQLYFDQFDFNPELTTNNDDGTISNERVYYTPDIMF